MPLKSHEDNSAVVITTVSDWNEPPRMRHHIAKQISKFCPVIYIQLYTVGKQSIIHREDDNLYIIKLGGYIRGFYRVRLFRAIFNYFQIFKIWKFLKKLPFDNFILLNFQYDFTSIKYLRKFFRSVLCFLNDDFVNIEPRDSLKTRKIKLRDLINTLQVSDHVFVSANILGGYADQAYKSYSCILSGHDFPVELYDESPCANPDGVINVCFMGYVSNNINYEWISIALDNNKIQMNFIGPVIKNDPLLSFRNRKNFTLYDPLVGVELYNFLKSQDVLIMPYTAEINNEMSTAPGKLFQYLAAGRPIVSSMLPNLIELPSGFVTQVSSGPAFLEAIHSAALHDSIGIRLARRKYASSHTWSSRGVEIWDVIKNLNISS
jgi:hypothetical protein